jgi:chemotaxis protein MotB
MTSTRHRQPSPNRERWLVSYADFITLLFAFFTTLYAISIMDTARAERLVRAIESSFGDQPFDLGGGVSGVLDARDGEVISIAEHPLRADPNAIERRIEHLAEKIRNRSQELGGTQGITTVRTREGFVIRLAESLFFGGGAATLAPEHRAWIEEIAAEIAQLPNHVRVEGHTDDRPSRGERSPTNWHLSVDRAVEVLRALEGGGVAGYRLSASGFADHRPLVSNGTLEGQRINRRVDIVILKTGSAQQG